MRHFTNVRWQLVSLVRPGYRKSALTKSVSVGAWHESHDHVAVVSRAKTLSMYIIFPTHKACYTPPRKIPFTNPEKLVVQTEQYAVIVCMS